MRAGWGKEGRLVRIRGVSGLRRGEEDGPEVTTVNRERIASW